MMTLSHYGIVWQSSTITLRFHQLTHWGLVTFLRLSFQTYIHLWTYIDIPHGQVCIDGGWTLVHVMAWCLQATSHHMGQCCQSSCHHMVSLGLNELKADICNINAIHSSGKESSHKSHNVLDRNPTMHQFVTEMCTHVHISVTKWCIVGYGSHNAPVCNRNVHTRPLFCYKMVHCGIWHWWLVHCGICATGQDQLFLSCNPL